MGNSLSRGTSDVIFILFPFVLSAGLIIMIVICWWKCKLLVDRRGSRCGHKNSFDGVSAEEPDFGHLINIQEYAENQVGTTILYSDSPGSSFPEPYVYFSDGRITRIVPLSPSSMAQALHQVQDPRNNNDEHLQLQAPSSSSSFERVQGSEPETSQINNGPNIDDTDGNAKTST